MSDSAVQVRFHGVRGTIPTPGPSTTRYGGNTLCVELRLGRRVIVLDAGTGIRPLGKELIEEGLPRELWLFITHHHWDHIQGLPLFPVMFVPDQKIHLCGPGLPDQSFEDLVMSQINGVHFPLISNDYPSQRDFTTLQPGPGNVHGLEFVSHTMRHPPPTLGYVFRHEGYSVAYITDNEIVDPDSDEFDASLVELVRGADLLIHDASYTDEEYATRVGWGHPPLSKLVEFAVKAEVKRLALFHHEPEHDDDAVDVFEAEARQRVADMGSSIDCFAAAEGMTFRL